MVPGKVNLSLWRRTSKVVRRGPRQRAEERAWDGRACGAVAVPRAGEGGEPLRPPPRTPPPSLVLVALTNSRRVPNWHHVHFDLLFAQKEHYLRGIPRRQRILSSAPYTVTALRSRVPELTDLRLAGVGPG